MYVLRFQGDAGTQESEVVAQSVSAFANTDGGSLFYGVNDEGEIVGLETRKRMQTLSAK